VKGIRKLSEREQAILFAVVERFVRDGRAISSADIQKEVMPDISTATIRADMFRLEQEGLLYKPHASAGRLPTEAGLRYYGEEILRRTPPVERSFHGRSRPRIADQVGFLNRTLASLSRDARAIAFLSYPLPEIDPVARFQVTLWEQRVLVLTLLFQSDWVYSRLFRLQMPLDPHLSFDEISERVTEAIRGMLIQNIRREILANALQKMPSADAFTRIISRFILSHHWMERIRVMEPPPEEMESGAVMEALHPIRAALSDSGALMRVIRRVRSSPQIIWGTDLRPKPIPRSVFILSQYRVNSLPGFLGIAGPVRMDYGRAVRTVQEFSEHLSAASSGL
jgi:heat-inducible transcriptional repressor